MIMLKLKRHLLFCAGVDLAILKNCSSRALNNQLLIGFCVKVSTLLSTFSGYHVALLVAHNPFISTVIGLFYGTIIFIVERATVSSLNEKKTARLFLSAIFCFTTATALVIFVTEHDIQSYVKQQNTQVKKVEASVAENRESNLALVREIKNLQSNYDELRNQRTALASRFQEEVGGKGLGAKGTGTISDSIANQLTFIDQEMKHLNERLALLHSKTDKIPKAELSATPEPLSADTLLQKIRILVQILHTDITTRLFALAILMIATSIELIPYYVVSILGRTDYEDRALKDQTILKVQIREELKNFHGTVNETTKPTKKPTQLFEFRSKKSENE